MKTFLIGLVLFGSVTHNSVANAQGSSCSAKENIAAEYLEWQKSFHKFLSEYESLNASKRFEVSREALKNILVKMQIFSDRTSVPMPISTVSHAKGLLTEIEAGRMAHLTANPILKSSLKKLEDSMNEMISKAQWINPSCNFAFRPYG
jgi:hypothetical protein